jgi:colanic acid biosynthesis glycosyl transferase WcaI
LRRDPASQLRVHVLVVSQYYAPEVGATQNRMRAFVEGLVARGHDVSVLCEQPNHPNGVFQPGYGRRPLMRNTQDRLTVYRVWVVTSPRKTTFRRLLFYGSFAAGASAIAGVVRRPDVLFMTSPPLPGPLAVALVAKWRRVPLVLDVRDLWPAAAEALGELGNRRVLRFFEGAERWLYDNAAAVTATTRPFCRYIDRLAGRPVAQHLPNGALDELVELPSSAPPAGVGFRLGYFGNFGIAQGLDIVLDAATMVKGEPIKFLLVGGGPRDAELRRQVEQRGLANVEVRAGVPVHQVGELMQSCHALLVPLSKHAILADFFPSKIYDAMAVGRPAIVAASGEADAFIREHKCGVTIPPEDGETLAAALRDLSSDRDKAAQLGAWGKAQAPEFARSRQAGRLCAILERVVRGGAPTPSRTIS